MNILIADDHPIVVNSFIDQFETELSGKTFRFFKCFSCQEIFETIEQELADNRTFDFVLLDYSMPPYTEKALFSGADLAIYIRKVMHDCKILIMTSSMDSITVLDIIQNAKPDAFFFKSDFVPADLQEILATVSDGSSYRSIGIIKKYKEGLDTKILLDPYNRKILQLIALGSRIKEISEELHLSEGAINKRIAKMKDFMDVKEASGLLKEAKIRGYV